MQLKNDAVPGERSAERANARLRPTGKALPVHGRAHNRSLVLQRLIDAGPVSRADLARSTGLTRVTVSDLVADLIEQGLIEELGTRTETRIGKPATLVGLRGTSRHIISLDLSDDTFLLGAVVDLHGNMVRRLQLPLDQATGDAAVALVIELTRQLIATVDTEILGVGIGTPGVVDPNGVVLQAPNMGWYDLPLAEIVGAATDLPIFVANDANAASLAESVFGSGTDSGLLFVALGHGVGGAILIDGALLSGPMLAAGEIGHIVVDPDGDPCVCGNTGCLETLLAVPHLRRRLAGLDAAAAQAELHRAGTILGTAIAPVVTTLGLKDVVVSGPRELIDGTLLDAARAAVLSRVMPALATHLTIRLESLADHGVLTGAAAHVRSGRLGVG